jgi:pyruvate ferredoxin oxidoreductase alpha subunit
MVKIRGFRPFPIEELVEVLGGVKVAAVLDRSDGLGAYGSPVFTEVRNALYDQDEKPEVVDYVFGLGGRDIGMKDIVGVYDDLDEIASTGEIKQRVSYLGVRE